jgi:hypothetical protein
MPNDHDTLATGALLLGGGLAGYALGHWLDLRGDDAAVVPLDVAQELSGDPPASSQLAARNARPARGAGRYAREGRTIMRDGVAVLSIARVDLGDQRYAITPHEADLLVEQIVRLLKGTGARRQSNAPRRRDARRKDPAHRERWLVDDRCGYRAWMFWTGAPPETAVVGDVWAYLERTSNGEILGKRRFRTRDEGHRYIKAALRRTLERAGKHDCYDF